MPAPWTGLRLGQGRGVVLRHRPTRHCCCLVRTGLRAKKWPGDHPGRLANKGPGLLLRTASAHYGDHNGDDARAKDHCIVAAASSLPPVAIRPEGKSPRRSEGRLGLPGI
jgi:hypothetical protein